MNTALPNLPNLALSFGFETIYYILLFIFVLHAIFLGYHWFAFGTSNHTSTIALAVYLGGGAVLFLTLASSLYLL